ncbi:probable beta-1,3-galactosyltransferase 1 [Actinia tenebrosa]|uniref:Hexosyltransferase n=1 Tax=Actinia tenebrosa TaxID=6105 RepID=A0A6P8IDT9_ACTTE|nr:probable beta-1,3-galactosyltransferase 1 [Actinia tenebrosa]
MHFKKLLCLFVLIFTTLLVLWTFRDYYGSYIYTSDEKLKPVKSKENQNMISPHEAHISSSNEGKFKRKVLLVIGIVSAPTREDRRKAIRQTWMNDACKKKPNVVCRFFTDSLSNMDRKWKGILTEEHSKYNDIEFMTVPRGLNFGLRMLWLIDWSISNYDFDFLLRLDDDYLVCLERLVNELKTRKALRLYWGYFHCMQEGQVRADEAFLMLSKDVIKSILQHRDDLFCSPFGDQSVAMWMKRIDHVIYFHDTRLLHEGMKSGKYATDQLCQSYIGVHNVYPSNAFEIWKQFRLQKKVIYDVPEIIPFNKLCKYSKLFDWRNMEEEYRFKPDRCINEPVWKHIKMWGGKGNRAEVPWYKRKIIRS